MTARQSNLTSWVAIALTIAGACGTGVWWAATISAKVDSMQETLTYLKNRIDGAPPATPTVATENGHDRTGARR